MAIIIGSGAGAGLLAAELVSAGVPTTILDKGQSIYSIEDLKSISEDIKKGNCVGGSTVIEMANMQRALEEELIDAGIDLSDDFDYVEKLIGVKQMDDYHIGKATKLFIEAARKSVLGPRKMVKSIDEDICGGCGGCGFACPQDAKWTALKCINYGKSYGLSVIDNVEDEELIIENDEVIGVKYVKDGHERTKYSTMVILAAGPIGSTLFLRSVGIDAGREFKYSGSVEVGGILEDIDQNHEVQMNAIATGDNFILTPKFSQTLKDELKCDDKDLFSLSVSSLDSGKGYIDDGGNEVEKDIDSISGLKEGIEIAKKVLKRAGVSENTIKVTKASAINPTGCAAIGEIVDTNLETEIKGLYVCDICVLPQTSGKPLTLTYLALAKRLADYLSGKGYESRYGISEYGVGKPYGIMSGWKRDEV